MLSLVKKSNPDDEKWLADAEKNAENRAKIFIDSGNHEKAATALKEIPYKNALVFLYELGKKYLHHHDKRAETVVKTSELIKKKKIKENTISLRKNKFPHGNHIPVFKKLTLSDVFEKEI